METPNTIHPEISAADGLIYKPCEFEISTPRKEAESAEYGAYAFELNGLNVRFRVAKVTPTKIGQFVTLWKRIGNGPIQPFDVSDEVDLFIVSTRKNNHFGQFIFPKSALCEQSIVSKNGKGGKRAMRVYPPWDKTTSKQAEKTQYWQLKYFLETPIDLARAKTLHQLGTHIVAKR